MLTKANIFKYEGDIYLEIPDYITLNAEEYTIDKSGRNIYFNEIIRRKMPTNARITQIRESRPKPKKLGNFEFKIEDIDFMPVVVDHQIALEWQYDIITDLNRYVRGSGYDKAYMMKESRDELERLAKEDGLSYSDLKFFFMEYYLGTLEPTKNDMIYLETYKRLLKDLNIEADELDIKIAALCISRSAVFITYDASKYVKFPMLRIVEVHVSDEYTKEPHYTYKCY